MAPPPASLTARQETQARRLRAARRVFLACLIYTCAATALWLFLMLTGKDGGLFFGNYRVSLQQVANLTIFFTLFWAIYSYAFHWLKYGLLKRAGLSREELLLVFGSRLEGFDLETLLARHSERTLRIIDMIGRRGRTILLVAVSFAAVYVKARQEPTPGDLAVGLQSSLFDAMMMSWWGVLTYHSNGVLGHMSYGAHARVLDGVQARANALCIGTLWNAFKFVMIPIGLRLAEIYPAHTYAVLYAFIWFSYATSDFAAEIFGSLWGKHRIRVWGLGDMNRKSWAGVVAAFVCTLAVNAALVWANHLPLAWWVLGVLLAVVNPLVELYSPRGTDDFTMATTNALICLGYGWLVFSH
jgi:hypothetical protein